MFGSLGSVGGKNNMMMDSAGPAGGAFLGGPTISGGPGANKKRDR